MTPTPAAQEAELLPCPFCGATDIRADHPNRAPRVYCALCRVARDSPQDWNYRPYEDAEPSAITALRRSLPTPPEDGDAHDLRPITMQDVRLRAGEGTLSAQTVLDAVNAELRERGPADELARTKARLAEAVGLLGRVRNAMLNGGDGQVGDYGWSITKLNRARPAIRAFLKSGGGHD